MRGSCTYPARLRARERGVATPTPVAEAGSKSNGSEEASLEVTTLTSTWPQAAGVTFACWCLLARARARHTSRERCAVN